MTYNADPWKLWFQTNTREAFVKASVILARGLHGTCLNGQENKIVIKGGGAVGKSLIVDTMVMDLADDKSAYQVPKDNKSMLEGTPSEACMQEKRMTITHQGVDFDVSFFNAESGDPYHNLLDARADKPRHGEFSYVSTLFNLFQNMDKPEIVKSQAKAGSLVLLSSFMVNIPDKGQYALVIDLRGMNSPHGDPRWGRRWEVSVENLSFRTPQMKNAIDTLRAYESNRTRRLRQKEVALTP